MKRPFDIIKKNKKQPNNRFYRPGKPQNIKLKENKESEKRDKYLELAIEIKNKIDPEHDGDSYFNWGTRYNC